ncbi:unnamed protein product [Ectocarpus sp. 12 AP-2014]
MNHGTCPEGMECACCFDDIEGGTDGNYVEYRTGEGKEWRPSLFCKMCIGVLIKSQWSIFEDTLAKATCKAQQKRMLGEGPPTHVHDKTALKCEEGESVHSLWFVGDEGGEPKIQSALLEGAPQGEARQNWWKEKRKFQFDEDEDEDDVEAGGNTTAATTVASSTLPPVPGAPSPSPVPPTPATDSPAAASATSNTAQAGESTETAAASPQAARAATVAPPVAAGAELTEAVAAPSKMDVEGGEWVSPPAAPVTASAPAIPLG